MKKLSLFFTVLFVTARLVAQTNSTPVRLALIVESSEAATVGDVLTAELSKNGQLHLLERIEIEKVYREQGLSAANKDYLKLGQILGADGLLLFDIVRTPQATNLTARLIAVKPGVVLLDEALPWPLKDIVGWSPLFAHRLDPLFPKLTVLVKDAIPISVVNFRSAVQSIESLETERQLKLLTIQRLSRERQLFVLERQRMQLLSEEKELKADDSAFWSGSYLLEGVVDQNGYSKEIVTINVRLTPSKGGAPLRMEVSGSRTNFAEVINQLALKVNEALKVVSTVKEWNAADEAAQYFDEARWALRWGVLPEAQAAADSAWALGKRDMECALVRVRAYLSEVPEVIPDNVGMGDNVRYVHINETPSPKYCDTVLYSLKCYYEFSRTSPDGEPKILSRGSGRNDLRNSDWYRLGIDDLVAASQVLQHYNSNPEWQKPVAGKLAEIRALSRAVAELISKSPSVHDSYFVGDRIATHDELAHTIGDGGNIFQCKASWGCFWQETPEDGVALYRELMSSPVFCYIHDDFWFREPMKPRLAAWNEADRTRIATVWNRFIQELNGSSNVLLRLEAKALRLADANVETESEKAIDQAFTNFFETIFENREELVANNVELFYLNWGADHLVQMLGAHHLFFPETSGIRLVNAAQMAEGLSPSDAKTRRAQRFQSDYGPKLKAMDEEYWQTTARGRTPKNNLAAFEKQKQYLKDNNPFDSREFVQMFIFGFKDYSKTQALEIQPLLGAYKSNLVVQVEELPNEKKGRLRIGIIQVGQVEANVSRILNPPAPKPKVEMAQNTNPPPVDVARPKAAPKIPEAPVEIVTNILLVKENLKIPLEQIRATDIHNLTINSTRWSDGKLILDLRFSATVDDGASPPVMPISGDNNMRVIPIKITGGTPQVAFAVFDSTNGKWGTTFFPERFAGSGAFRLFSWNKSGLCCELFQGNFYLSEGGQVKKYDFKTRQWETLNVPSQNNSQMFAIDGHLYSANAESIIEITDGGKGTRILASTRRKPAASILDSFGGLGSPFLFTGLNHLLCASIGNKIFGWNGNDWSEVLTTNSSGLPEVFEDAVIFRDHSRSDSEPATLWLWDKTSAATQLYLRDQPQPRQNVSYSVFPKPLTNSVKPLWRSPMGDHLASSAATFFQSNLYFFVDHAVVTNVSGRWTVAEKDGYHAKLICLSREFSGPVVVPLKFDQERGQPPLKSLGERLARASWLAGSTWIFFAGDSLYIGQPESPTIWVIPVSEVQAAIAAQKKAGLAEKQQRDRRGNELMAKYDKNNNGIFEAEEKEAAIDDQQYLATKLLDIDVNDNGVLDKEELRFFDVNTNSTLDAHEQVAIDKTLSLLTDRLLDKLNQDEQGKVKSADVPAELISFPGGTMPVSFIGRDKLLELMRSYLYRSLSLRGGLMYVSLPTNVVGSLKDFSVTMWVNLVSDSMWSRIFDFGSNTTNYMFLTPKSSGGSIRFAITTGGIGREEQINGRSALPTGSWHHLAVTLHGNVGILYVDGAPVGTNNVMTLTPASLESTTQNWIGRSRWGGDPYLNGVVDEFRIYSRALSADEIASPIAPRAALQAYLKFDESTGATAADSTGHGWNGALMGGANWVAGHSNDAVWLNGLSDFMLSRQQIIDLQLLFKVGVEAYWRSSITNEMRGNKSHK